MNEAATRNPTPTASDWPRPARGQVWVDKGSGHAITVLGTTDDGMIEYEWSTGPSAGRQMLALRDLFEPGRRLTPQSVLAAGQPIPAPAAKPKRKRRYRPNPNSRPARWARAASAALAAIEELIGMQEEFSEWQSNLPDNLQNSGLADKLQEVCNLDLQGAMDTISEAEGAELPLGFGRD